MVKNSRRYVPLAMLVAIVACDVGAPLYSRTDDPVLTLVLSPSGTTYGFLLADISLPVTAVFAVTGVPTHVEFVRAEAFETFRASDNAPFDWTEAVPPVPPDGAPTFRPTSGNYLLADSTTSRGLGRSDLRPGETYRLRVSYAGQLIEGTTRIPEEPQPQLIDTPEGLRVVWPSVPGVPLYFVAGANVTPASPYAGVTADTVAIPTIGGGSSVNVRVFALDSNYARYLSDTSVTRSGLTGAYGVFGAISMGVVEGDSRLAARRPR